jgi:hypothetical protein
MLLIFPAAVIAVLYHFWLQNYVLDNSNLSNQVQALFPFFVYGILSIYLGWALTWWKDRIFLNSDLLTYNDRLYFDERFLLHSELRSIV